MSDTRQFDGFPESRIPDIPPLGPFGRRFNVDPDVPVGVDRNPIPDSGFPVNRGFAENWDYEFTPNRQTVSAAAPETYGAFYGTYTISSEDATNGDIYLRGGQVSAGTDSVLVDDFLLYDASAESWAGTDGQALAIRVNGNGEAVDGVLMPVFNLTTIDGPTALTTPLPDHDLPTVADVAGECVISLGVFTNGGFSPALPGNIQVSFCFGGFNISRF